jgi:glycosyltransferase involved in cell wall biosynthesis
MPNGVNPALLDPDRHRGASRYFDDLTLVLVGALFTWQGVEPLLEAVADLRSENRVFSLLIIGDGPELNRLQQRAEALDLTRHVRFLGRIAWDQIPRCIAACDLGFSDQIPMKVGMYLSPLKLYEYTAMGRALAAVLMNTTFLLPASPQGPEAVAWTWVGVLALHIVLLTAVAHRLIGLSPSRLARGLFTPTALTLVLGAA